LFIFFVSPRLPPSTLFPYTTLFRSRRVRGADHDRRVTRVPEADGMSVRRDGTVERGLAQRREPRKRMRNAEPCTNELVESLLVFERRGGELGAEWVWPLGDALEIRSSKPAMLVGDLGRAVRRGTVGDRRPCRSGRRGARGGLGPWAIRSRPARACRRCSSGPSGGR